jgi:hypothetical protein
MRGTGQHEQQQYDATAPRHGAMPLRGKPDQDYTLHQNEYLTPA